MLFFIGHPVRVRQVAANAVKASGLDVIWQDIPLKDRDSLEIAFFQTRPIHIRFERLSLTLWRVDGPRYPYPIIHSWSHVYPTWDSLLASVPGIRVLNPGG